MYVYYGGGVIYMEGMFRSLVTCNATFITVNPSLYAVFERHDWG